jgi:outer membrane protein OmpA-like peptidoglycan-associated protein
MALRRLLLLCCICSYLSAYAQVQIPLRALQAYDRSMRCKAKKEHAEANKYMALAITTHPAYTEAYSTLGEWLVHERRYTEAIELFRMASAKCPNGNRAFAKPLARSLLYNYEYRVATELANTYAPPKGDKDWEEIKQKSAFMAQHLSRKWKDTAFNMGGSINSRYAEFFPCMGADTSVLYFTRRHNGIDEDFYRTTTDSCGGWFYARNMGEPLNTPSQEAAQMISADGHYLFITRCDNKSENGWTQGGCDLLMAYTADSIWSVPQSFGATINTPAYEGMACLSPDNRELYFTSDREGGYGGLDIWVSRFEGGLWQLPRNMGPDINTAGDETAPFIHTDNRTFYFASDGLAGFGGSDFFRSKRINDSTWSRPDNLGYPFNTTGNETSLFITVDGTKAYFASDRDSAAGNFDIYEMKMPKQLQPEPVAIIKGYAYDSISREKLNYTSIYITDLHTDEQLYHFISNRGDGSYMITLPVGHNYLYQADRIGYTEVADTIFLDDVTANCERETNIALLPQDYQKPVEDSTVAVIYFPINSAKLSDSDRVILQQAIAPWLNKDILVMVNGYTDNTGTPLINEQLSYMRAGLVSKEMGAAGVRSEKVRAAGWGEAEPIATNDTEDGRNLNRRVEVVIRW